MDPALETAVFNSNLNETWRAWRGPRCRTISCKCFFGLIDFFKYFVEFLCKSHVGKLLGGKKPWLNWGCKIRSGYFWNKSWYFFTFIILIPRIVSLTNVPRVLFTKNYSTIGNGIGTTFSFHLSPLTWEICSY